MKNEYTRKLYSHQSHHENFSEDKIAFRNIKTIMANEKKLEYQMNIIEDLLTSILKEIKELKNERNI